LATRNGLQTITLQEIAAWLGTVLDPFEPQAIEPDRLT